MRVDANITRMDLVRINLLLWPHVRFNWVYLTILFVIGFVASMKVSDTENFLPFLLGLSIIIASVIAISISAATFLFCLTLSILGASERTGLGHHLYEIIEDGLKETTRINSELSKWESFQKVWNFKSYIVLKKHWAALHIFPLRCFDSRQQFEAFYAALVEHINK